MDGVADRERQQSGQIRARAKLRQKAQITLPEEVRQALHVREGDEIEFTVNDDGSITVRGFVSVPSDQVWLYTPARSGEDRRGGSVHESASAMFAHLNQLGSADVA